jgi:hypothetical protein
VQINGERTSVNDVGALLDKLYGNRAERVLFIKGEPETLFKSVAEVVDAAKARIELVVRLTPSVEAQRCWESTAPTPIDWASTGRRPLK